MVPLHNGKEAVREVEEPGDFIFFAGQNGRMTGEALVMPQHGTPIVGVGAARVAFEAPVSNPEEVRRAMVGLAKAARAAIG